MTMHQDIYLSFASEAEAESVLFSPVPPVYGADVDGYTKQPNYQNIDVIGVMYMHSSNPNVQPTPIPGWHVNVRVMPGEDASALEPFTVHPNTPYRVWA